MSNNDPKLVGKIVMTDAEIAQRAALKRAARPRLASTIVLTQGPRDNPRILMGQRSSRHDFMPSVYVFPGGRVDRGDSYAPYHGDLSPRTEHILESAYNPRRARALVLAAIRETFEETSLLLGEHSEFERKSPTHPTWQIFHDKGFMPHLSDIEVFGRAITPPHRHKRYDTWFFLKHLDDKAVPKIADSAELLNVGWFTFDQISALKLQRATTMMLDVLRNYLKDPRPAADVFFSRNVRGQYRIGRFPE